MDWKKLLVPLAPADLQSSAESLNALCGLSECERLRLEGYRRRCSSWKSIPTSPTCSDRKDSPPLPCIELPIPSIVPSPSV